jgi:hypothetical protein
MGRLSQTFFYVLGIGPRPPINIVATDKGRRVQPPTPLFAGSPEFRKGVPYMGTNVGSRTKKYYCVCEECRKPDNCQTEG